MKPFWLMTIMCVSVWSVVALIIFVWVRMRRTKDPVVERNDREMLEEIRSMDLVQQIRLSTSADPRVRLYAVAAMDGNRQDRAIDAVIARLSDEDEEVVAEALKALGGLGETRATDAFLDKVHEDDEISYHPGLLRRQLDYGSDRLVDWLAKRAIAGDAGAIPAIGSYRTHHAVGVLISLLQGDAFYLWDRRRREAAEQLAHHYLSDTIDPVLKRAIAEVEGYVWMDSRGASDQPLEENGDSVRVPVGRDIHHFIETQRQATGLEQQPQGDA